MQLVSSFEVGGVQRLLVSLARDARADPSVRHIVVIMNEPVDSRLLQALELAQTTVIALHRKPGHLSPVYLLALHRIVRENGAAIIQTHNYGSRTWGTLLKFVHPGLRLAHTMHASGQIGRTGWISRLVFRWLFSAVIAVSRSVEEECKRAGVGRVVRIENGIDIDAFRRVEPLLPSTSPPFRIVNLARFEPCVKGQDVLIEAVAICRSRGLAISCTLVGPHNPSQELRELVDRLGLADCVSFVIDPDDVAPWLHRADAFVLPSRSEAFGLALVEAMAAGLPVVASRVGALTELVQDGRNGLLVNPGDPGQLADALLTLAEAPALRARLAQEGRHTADAYSIGRMRQAYHDLYRSLLQVGPLP